MSECGESPYLDGLGDVMMIDTLKLANFSSDVKEEELDLFPFPTAFHDTDMDWNMDTMNYEDESMKDVFPLGLLDVGSPFNDSFSKQEAVSQDVATTRNSIINGCAANVNSDTDATTNVEFVLNDLENSLINSNTVTYEGLLNGNCSTAVSGISGGNTNGTAPNDTTVNGAAALGKPFEDFIPSLPMTELLSPKEEMPSCSPLDVVTTMGGNMQTVNCKLSPSYSIGSEFWDSGVSADDEASPPGGRMDQQLSPESDYTATSPTPDYLASFNSPRPLSTPQRSPSSSNGSGYSSSSSPSSSPESSPLPTIHHTTSSSIRKNSHFTTTGLASAVATPSPARAIVYDAAKNTNPSHQSAGTVTSTPQFSIQKRLNPNNKLVFSRVVSSNGVTVNRQPISVVSSSNNNFRLTPVSSSTARVTTSTIIGNNHSTTKAHLLNSGSPKVLQHKASPSPSVVTLSGVNKTAGIIKSPSVINVSRKQPINTITTINNNNNSNSFSINNNNNGNVTNTSNITTTISNNNINGTKTSIITGISQQQQQKPINIISTSGELVSSNILNSSTSSNGTENIITRTGNVLKPFKLSQPGRLISGANGTQQIVFQTCSKTLTAAGKVIKTPNTYFIKGGEKIKLVSTGSSFSNSSGTGTFSSSSPLRSSTMLGTTFVNANPNRNRINGVNTVTSGSGMRSTNLAILKNVRVPLGSKSVQSIKDSITSLVTIPKEEIDSDDEVEVHKNNQPLTLTEEERKLASKEGIKFPSHYPLTRSQERDLKRIRRKLRNKQSAQDSRKRKKEHLDNILQQLTCRETENGNLKQKLANAEENNRKLQESNRILQEQIKKFHAIMDSQTPPSVTRSNSHHHSNSNNNSNSSNNNNRQQQATFLMMIVLSLALFVFPSVHPQSKVATELLSTMPHRMPPAGNTRSLLEAASVKLPACQDDDTCEDIDVDSKSIPALTDHDYVPPSKRGRFTFSPARESSLYCMPQLDEQLPSPRKKQLPGEDGGGSLWHDGKDDSNDDVKEKAFAIPNDGAFAPSDDRIKLKTISSPSHFKKEEDTAAATATFAMVGKLDPDLATKISQGVLDSMKNQLDLRHNWTQPDMKKSLDSLSQSLVVELATRATKRFREDIELE